MSTTGTEKERYVTRAELARIMGISTRQLDRLVSEGMPSETWGMRGRWFLASAALRWARERGRRTAE